MVKGAQREILHLRELEKLPDAFPHHVDIRLCLTTATTTADVGGAISCCPTGISPWHRLNGQHRRQTLPVGVAGDTVDFNPNCRRASVNTAVSNHS